MTHTTVGYSKGGGEKRKITPFTNFSIIVSDKIHQTLFTQGIGWGWDILIYSFGCWCRAILGYLQGDFSSKTFEILQHAIFDSVFHRHCCSAAAPPRKCGIVKCMRRCKKVGASHCHFVHLCKVKDFRSGFWCCCLMMQCWSVKSFPRVAPQH